MRAGLAGGLDGGQGAHDGFQVQLVAGARVRVHGVGGEDDFVAEFPFGFVCLGQFALEDQAAGLFQFGHLNPEVDGGDAVEIGELLHGAGGAGVFAGLQGFQHVARKGIDKADVGFGIGAPGLAHDAFHATVDLLRGSAAVVDGKFHKDEVGVMGKDVLAATEHAKVGAGAADGGVDLGYSDVGKLFLEPPEGLGPPAVLGGDAAAEIGDAHVLSLLEFAKEIGQPLARVGFDGFHAGIGEFRGQCVGRRRGSDGANPGHEQGRRKVEQVRFHARMLRWSDATIGSVQIRAAGHGSSHTKPEEQHVAVADDVVAAFDAVVAGFAGVAHRAFFDQVLASSRLRP